MSAKPLPTTMVALLCLVLVGCGGGAFDEPDQGGSGVTDEVVKVGFVAVKPEAGEAKARGFGVDGEAKMASPSQQIEAITNWINDNGGIAGRTMQAEVVFRDPEDSRREQGVKPCIELTEDHRVFAAIDYTDKGGAECYAEHHTLFLANVPIAEQTFQSHEPYIWSPGQKSTEHGYGALLQALVEQDFFAGDPTVGVITQDDPASRRIYEEVVKTRIDEIGVAAQEAVFISESGGDPAAELNNAVLKFKSANVNRVIFMLPGAAAPLVFMTGAETQQYRPRYAVSSYDQPGSILQDDVPPAQLRDAVGAGWVPSADVDEQHGAAYPTGAGEKQCYDALEAAGIAPTTRAAGAAAAVYCDGAFMLKAAAEGLDELTAAGWAERAGALGDNFESAFALPGGTKFDGNRDGNRSFRTLRFDADCGCFSYDGEANSG